MKNTINESTTADVLSESFIDGEIQSNVDFDNLDEIVYNSSSSFDISEIADILLDNIQEYVFITDSISKNIVYLNKPLSDALGLTGAFVGTCHSLIKGCNKQCAECNANHAIDKSFYVTSLVETKLKDQYTIKSRTINLYDCTYNINIAIQKNNELYQDRLTGKPVFNIDEIIEPYTRIYIQNIKNPDIQVYRYLECFGLDTDASFCALYEYKKDEQKHSFLDLEEEVTETNSKSQASNFRRSQLWANPKFRMIATFEEISEQLLDKSITQMLPCIYDTDEKHKLFSLPLFNDDIFIGCIFLYNPNLDRLSKYQNSLQILGNLFSSALSHRKMHSELTMISNQDTLTNLKNRQSLLNDVNILSVNSDIGIIFLNVNGLKQINSNLGLKNGDTILLKTASLLKQLLHNSPYIYRIGGDEFLGIITNIKEHDFLMLSDMIKAFMSSDKGFSVSVGSYWTKFGINIQKAINNAETDMYAEKKKFYRNLGSAEIKVEDPRYRSQNDSLLNIIEPDRIKELVDNGAFKILYQPKYAIQGEQAQIAGAEALVRLVINGATVPPDDFIPALESAHYTHLIDYHVFDAICKKMREQLDQGKKILPVSCNFSRHTIVRPEFSSKLKQIMDHYHLSYDLIPLEVSEHTSTQRHQELVAVTKFLQAEGFKISIDDFGTAHANIYTLADLSVNEVKFDKKLIDNLGNKDNYKLTTILSVLITMCKKLGIQTTAEGVEQKIQNDILKELGCDEIQGYYYSKPISCDEYYDKVI